MKYCIFIICFIVCGRADVSILNKNLELFKYDPNDIFSLPEDIDEEKPAVVFAGDVMKAKVEKLQNLKGKNQFKLELKTQNGIEVSSVGKLKDGKAFVVSGSYSFTGADGKRYRTRYTADEFGYHPITELDLSIPEPQLPDAALSSKTLLSGLKNKFQFLKQNLNANPTQQLVIEPELSDSRYNAYDGDNSAEGYYYNIPSEKINLSIPSRQYLPVQ